MNRRSLLKLATGLIVGEPALRAYSFLNGHGLPRVTVEAFGKGFVAMRDGFVTEWVEYGKPLSPEAEERVRRYLMERWSL
jgi:hypothetical protein